MTHGDDFYARQLSTQPFNSMILLDGEHLSLNQLLLVAKQSAQVALSDEARHRISVARTVVDSAQARGDSVYGMNTDLGPLTKVRIKEEEIEQFQVRTLVGHSVAHGSELDSDTVRAMIVARVNGFARGGAGVRLDVAEKLLEMLNKGVHPIVVSGGSVGQSDLSDMAQIAQVAVGMGEAEVNGKRLPGMEALVRKGITPLKLASKEALALISANGLTLGRGSLVLLSAIKTMHALELSAALALEAFGANLSILHNSAAKLKAHPGHERVADRLRAFLSGSCLFTRGAARNLQDPLSFRCVPQVHGALDEAVESLRRTIEIELNSASDNPLVSIDDETIVSVGNFDVTNVAIGFDTLRIALIHTLNLANERIQKQTWRHFSGLSTGLERRKDPLSRLIPIARTAAALTAEAQAFASPASLSFRAQIAEGIEDHASFGPLAVKRTEQLLELVQRVLTLELIISASAIVLRKPSKMGCGTSRAFNFIDKQPFIRATEWQVAIDRLLKAVGSGELVCLANTGSGNDTPPNFKIRAHRTRESEIQVEPNR